jgi:hypothetical protein
MTTPAEYREFAHDCRRWADETDDASRRSTLIGIARIWTLIAIAVDDYVTLAGDDPVRSRELRAKLN